MKSQQRSPRCKGPPRLRRHRWDHEGDHRPKPRPTGLRHSGRQKPRNIRIRSFLARL